MTGPDSAPTFSTWRLVLHLARYRLGVYLASGILASIMFYLFPLIPGVIVKRVFDTLAGAAGIPGETSLAVIRMLVWLFIAAAVARVLVIFFASMAESTLHFLVNTLLQRNMLAHVLTRPGARALPYSPGEAVSRFREDVSAITAFLSWTIDPVGQAIGIGVGVAVLAQVNLGITLAIFLPLAGVVFVLNRATQRIRAYRRDTQQSIGHVTGLVGEMFGAVASVKAAGAEEHVVRRLETLNEQRRAATLRDTLFNQFLSTISYNMGSLGTGILLVAAAGAMARGAFSIGDFALFVSYIEWLTFITGMFGNFLARYRQVTVSFERMLALMQDAPVEKLVAHQPNTLWGKIGLAVDATLARSAEAGELAVEDLTYLYPETGRGVAGVSFRMAPGTLTVITGRIGSGKTTLLRALLGLLPATGSWTWNSEEVADPASFFVPPRSAYTPQIPRLFSETLRDNLLMGIADERELQDALFLAVMEEDVGALEQGLQTMVGPRGVKLSGGQRQRAAAARMFTRRPALLVFDDLSSALDVNTERALWDRLFKETGSTVLAVSHRKSVLRRADQVILLEEGQVAAMGPLEELLATSEGMRDLWEGG